MPKYRISGLEDDLNFFTPSHDKSAIGLSDGTGRVYGVAYESKSHIEQFIHITKTSGDSILVGKFQKDYFRESK